MGFETGNILEPSMGVGNFFGMLPDMCIRDRYWTEHQQDFFYIVDGSFVEEYDEFNIGVQFKAAATVSITYACLLYTS